LEEIVSPKVAVVGDCYSAEEELANQPFLGGSGRLLSSILVSVGVSLENCLFTNVFNLRPPGNKLKNILVTRDQGAPGWPSLLNKKYIPASLVSEVERCLKEVKAFKPDVILCLGGVAMWAFLGKGGLSSHRGHYHEWNGIKLIPTYHPTRILRNYNLKICLASDIEKAKKLATGESQLIDIKFNAEPNIQQIKEFLGKAKEAGLASVDIETVPKFRAITCVGIGLPDYAICVPFFHERKIDGNYWSTDTEEIEAVRLVKNFIEDISIKKIWHHGTVYDIPWLADVLGICAKGLNYDTRIIHSCLMPELPHSLSDIVANYLVFPPWKTMHNSSKESDSSNETDE